MSEPTLTFTQQMNIVVTTGLFTLGGAFIGLAANIFSEYLKGRKAIKLERLKIHDVEKKNAYKELIVFTKDILNNSFPMYEEKVQYFTSHMKRHYRNILSYYPYYTKAIIEILDEMEEQYTCLTSPDLIDIADETRKDYIEKKLYEKASALYKIIKREIREWT